MLFETAAVSEPSVNVSVYEPANALRARPLKVATPATAVALAFVTETPPVVIRAVAVDVSEAITFPAASSTFTTGFWARTAPLGALDEGWVVMTN